MLTPRRTQKKILKGKGGAILEGSTERTEESAGCSDVGTRADMIDGGKQEEREEERRKEVKMIDKGVGLSRPKRERTG